MFLRPRGAGGGETARTWSSSSSSSSSTGRVSLSSSLSAISNGSGAYYDDQQQAAEGSAGNNGSKEEEQQEAVQVGVAVGKEVKECKANLMWVLSNLDAIVMAAAGDKTTATVVLLHVHRPAKTIPFMGASFPAEQLHESEVSAFRQAETQAMNRAMARYRAICAKVKVQAVCRVETVASSGGGDNGDVVAQGILRLVARHGIRLLVVGAAADKRYSRKMTAPSSRTAASVQQQAAAHHPLCSIWFVCKGNVVCSALAMARPSAVVDHVNNVNHHAIAMRPTAAAAAAEEDNAAETVRHAHGVVRHAHGVVIPPPDLPVVAATRRHDEAVVQLGTLFIQSQSQSRQRPLVSNNVDDEEEELIKKKKQQQQEDIQSIFAEAEKLQMRREQREREEQEKVVAALEAQVVSSKRVIQDLQEKLSEAHCLLFSLEREQEDLRRQRDAALQEAAALRHRLEQQQEEEPAVACLMELSYDELMEATNNLDDSLRIQGQQQQAGGGYGTVYRAVLRRNVHQQMEMEVAVKVLIPTNNHLQQQQVEELSKLRHPNVVRLLGLCSAPQAWALVYEYLPGGSLDDRLDDRRLLNNDSDSNTNSSCCLSWPERTRIAADIRSALVFLHRNEMLHGDLKPTNVLLTTTTTTGEAELRAKLADAGLCRLLEASTLSASTVAYMDPEFLASGELRPSSDVYAFGVLLLRLLTGRPAMGLARQVQAALAKGTAAADIFDASAGEWPYTMEQAEQLARLALACCDMTSANRPDLADDMVAHTLGSFQLPVID